MKKFIITEEDRNKIIGLYEQTSTEQTKTLTNKVSTEGIKNVIPGMITSPQFKGQYSGYVFGGEFEGVNYQWDCNGVEGMSGVKGMVDGDIITETVDKMFESIKKPMTDGKSGTLSVGFYSPKSGTKFIIYMTTSNKPKCIYF